MPRAHRVPIRLQASAFSPSGSGNTSQTWAVSVPRAFRTPWLDAGSPLHCLCDWGSSPSKHSSHTSSASRSCGSCQLWSVVELGTVAPRCSKQLRLSHQMWASKSTCSSERCESSLGSKALGDAETSETMCMYEMNGTMNWGSCEIKTFTHPEKRTTQSQSQFAF